MGGGVLYNEDFKNPKNISRIKYFRNMPVQTWCAMEVFFLSNMRCSILVHFVNKLSFVTITQWNFI